MQLRFVCLYLVLAAAGCAKVKAAVCADVATAAKPIPANTAGAPADATAKEDEAEPAGDEADEANAGALHASATQEQFALPFAWEREPSEPLSRTRAYLREMARDNAQHMGRGPEFFKAFAAKQTPRATVLACADSRVQAGAFDATPENDDFTVRNLGNQLGPSLGAVQYGVEHLKTPLLVILGHTGCGAVKAALSGTATLPEPIRNELAGLQVGARKTRGPSGTRWRDAVLENVNDQVERALKTFAGRVNAGQLTIVGAVYDFRNDLDQGPGRVSIVNVNGTTDANRLKAFHEAVLAGVSNGSTAQRVDPFERLSQAFAEHLHEQGQTEDEPPAKPAAPEVRVRPAAAATMPAGRAAGR